MGPHSALESLFCKVLIELVVWRELLRREISKVYCPGYGKRFSFQVVMRRKSFKLHNLQFEFERVLYFSIIQGFIKSIILVVFGSV